MATERKRQKLEKESDVPSKRKPLALFLPPDVILEVEGMQLHVRKQVLADNSPVFKSMLESEFKEKHQIKITLPEKKYEDVEIFLRTFYHPDIQCPISKDTVLSILPLAEEYQVLKVKERCEKCMVQTLQSVTKQGMHQTDAKTILIYVTNAELYNLSSALPLAIQMCARYDEKTLKEAGIDTMVSEKMLMTITKERNRLLETLTISRIQKGVYASVLENFQVLSGLMEEGRQSSMIIYEETLTSACEKFKTINASSLVELIISADQLNLQKLLPAAITLASKCNFDVLKNTSKFNEISDGVKLRICEERISNVERYGNMKDVRIKI